jgi:hypothetical protein
MFLIIRMDEGFDNFKGKAIKSVSRNNWNAPKERTIKKRKIIYITKYL